MTTAATTDLTTQLVAALKQVRAARHHPDCTCRLVPGGFCTPEEKIWNNSVDRILEAIRRTTF